MSNATSVRALWVGAACLLAVGVALMARAPHATASAPDVTEAASCGSGEPRESLNTLMDRTLENIRTSPGRAGTDEESGWVVLNNRGYNYGGQPGVQMDAHLFEREGAGFPQH